MRINQAKLIVVIFLTALFASILSCKTDAAALLAENSLPQSEIAYYNDPLDKMREDLWDRAGYLWTTEQMQNFKQADLRFIGDKLIVRTRTGSFSKGGFGSNFVLRGDFDIQVDCRMQLIRGLSGMDQIVDFLVIDNRGRVGQTNNASVSLIMVEGSYQGWIESRARKSGRGRMGKTKKIDNFDGTLRIIRQGTQIGTLYKNKAESTWNRLDTFSVSDNDMLVGFQLRNFSAKRKSIRAKYSLSAEFDNFKINAAHAIIENEI